VIRPQSPLLDFRNFPEQRRRFGVTSPRAPHGLHFPNGEALLASITTYTVTITGVKDTAGNQMVGTVISDHPRLPNRRVPGLR
jgi:hypothetical protein